MRIVSHARLIALDWGTSTLRAYLLGPAGRVLDETSLPLGIMRLNKPGSNADRATLNQTFESAFEQACASWLQASPLPIMACGMIASAQGWCEAPYLRVPIELRTLAGNLTQATSTRGRVIHFVPGLIRSGELVNVMRGEETQIFGALTALGSATRGDLLICLPGTHSKWARVNGTVVKNFETFMTGEVYEALCEHTILGHTMKRESSFHAEAFDRGLRVAISRSGNAGLLSNIFSVRTLALTDKLAPQEQPDYLSGLLIGDEVSAMAKPGSPESPAAELAPVVLVGDAALCARYEHALKMCQRKSVKASAQASARGLWEIAVEASLVSGTG